MPKSINAVWTDPYTPIAEACQQCESYPSLIRFFPWRSAGVIDVSAIIMLTTILAGRLCARIELPRPCEMLSLPLMGVEMPLDVDWDNYYKATYRLDGASIFVRERENGYKKPEREMIPAAHFSVQLQQAMQMADAGEPFEWQFISDFQDENWATMNLTSAVLGYARTCTDVETPSNMAPDFTQGPIQLEASRQVKALAASLRTAYNFSEGEYLAMHLRRGDALGVCDDTIDGIIAYASCTLAGRPTEEPLVIFTDEKDGDFLTGLLGNMSLAWAGKRVVVLGDKTLATLMPSADPAQIFTASLLLRLGASAQLLMDRAHCTPCDTAVQNETSLLGLILNAQFHEAPRTSAVTQSYWQRSGGRDGSAPACTNGTSAYTQGDDPRFKDDMTEETVDSPRFSGDFPPAWNVLHSDRIKNWVQNWDSDPQPHAAQRGAKAAAAAVQHQPRAASVAASALQPSE